MFRLPNGPSSPAVLKGELPATELDPRLQEPIAKMRTHIDALSRRMIESGAAEGPVSLTIENNLGTYVAELPGV